MGDPLRHLFRALLCLPLLVGGSLLVAPSASAAPAVKISFVYFDSPGSDTGSNTSLNAEYVTIKNTSSTARSLTGWTLRDKTGYTYKFPTFTLKAGATVTVHTGKGTASSTHRYYNRTSYVWNNTGDTAYLKNSSGTTVHTCSWTSAGSTKTC
jgi:predicted secreted Zn-dependent protease